MQIFLHIGVEKTGTSSIQKFLRVNREKLKERRILFPESPGVENHMALAAAAQDELKRDDLRMLYELDCSEKIREFRKDLSERLVRECVLSGCTTLILSGEHCSSRLVRPSEVQVLARILRPLSEQIRIIVYLRRQDEFLCSTYSTDVKSGSVSQMQLPSPELREQRYNYYTLLQRWASVFGKENLEVRIYDISHMKNGDVVDDFLSATVHAETADGFTAPDRVNESLDTNALEFLRMFNSTVPRFKEGRLNEARGNIAQLLQRVSKGPAPALSSEQLSEFMQYFSQSNRKVAAEFFGHTFPDGDPLFGPTKPRSGRAAMQSITAEAAVHLAALLWEQKNLQVAELKQRIAVLTKKKQVP